MKNKREQSGRTELLFETDSYCKEFTAEVLDCRKCEDKDLFGVILNATAFFPEGGGQTCDQGTLNGVEVVDVQTVDGEVVHFVNEAIPVGSTVEGKIEWVQRFRKMQNHSGEHLFCGLIHNAFGYDNVGFHMNEVEVTLDVNGPLSGEDLARIEKMANEYILQRIPITVAFPSAEEAKTLDYRSKLELTVGIRLVTIEGIDVCACCAPHVSNTSEIGMIHVMEFLPHRGGTRITLRCGASAYEDYSEISENNAVIVKLLSAKRYETGKMTESLQERYQNLQKELSFYKRTVTDMTITKIMEEMDRRAPEDSNPMLIFSEILDMSQLRNLLNQCKEGKSYRLAGFLGDDAKGYDYIVCGGSEPLPDVAKRMNAALQGRGGGNVQMIQGHVQATEAEIKTFMQQ